MSNNQIERREFLKWVGSGALAATAMAAGCKPSQSSRGGSALGEVPTDKMSYRTTPTTGDKVSLLGYGCMRWPVRKKADGSGDEIDQEAVNELIDYAIAHGVNYFDTSPRYVQGWSETATGIALKRHPREKFFIATKLSTFPNDPVLRSQEGSLAMYHKSFADLQVDYFDYYLIHGAGVGKVMAAGEKSTVGSAMSDIKERLFDNGILDFLLAERKSGKIKNLGWSFHGDVAVFDYMLRLHDEGTAKWDFVQIQLNYIDWKYASGWNVNADYLYSELEKRGIPAVVMEPLLGGRLSNLPQYLIERLKQQRPSESVASWAFRYAASFPGVLTVLSGMTYMEHLQENVRTYSPLEPLTEDEFSLLYDTAKLFMEYSSVPCTACQYCMPCPYGIDIPSVFSHYNKCINAGTVLANHQDSHYRRARREFLIGYDRSVPKLRQANHCIGCDKCVENCPQGINIPEQLARIDTHVEKLKRQNDYITATSAPHPLHLAL